MTDVPARSLPFLPVLSAALAAAGIVTPLVAAPAAAPVEMSTRMTGAAEVPGPGAPQGAGIADIRLDPSQGRLCFRLTVKGTDTPTMAHVHKGATGVAGPVTVVLAPPKDGRSKGCVSVAADTLDAIIASPRDYYVNVHTATYPKGAMRGQLGG